MKTTTTLSIILCSLGLNAIAQDCSTGRYLTEVFTTVNTTSDIQYGQNINLSGNNEVLLMDVYEPVGDALSERPLLIWAHGGSFIGGSKTETDVLPLAQDFAKMGYVTASINYRLGMNGLPFPGPDSTDATETVIRAVHDGRAAVRFFKKDYAENGNTYGIDTNNIFFGGVSAGGILTVHLGYLDQESEMPSYVDTTQAGLGGGIEGNSGNPGYKSNVKALINSAGALRDTSWMKAGDTPLISFHGDADGTVPYGTAVIQMVGVFDIMVVNGSSSIHEQADKLGMNNCFEPWPGQDHVPHVSNAAYYDTLVTMTSNFLMQFVCGGPSVCDYVYDTSGFVGINSQYIGEELSIRTFPNPAVDQVKVLLENGSFNGSTVDIYDSFGKLVRSYGSVFGNELLIDKDELPSGIYLINGLGEAGRFSSRLVFE